MLCGPGFPFSHGIQSLLAKCDRQGYPSSSHNYLLEPWPLSSMNQVNMQDYRGLDEDSVRKLRKKKTSQQNIPLFQRDGNNLKRMQELHARSIQNGLKPSKRVPPSRVSPLFQQSEKLTPGFLPDASTSGNDYRALRRKYLLLEEESFALGKELREAEDEIQALEDEKLALLDDLVVLEGLVDPSEIQSQGHRF